MSMIDTLYFSTLIQHLIFSPCLLFYHIIKLSHHSWISNTCSINNQNMT